jgi:hypothetical protein
MSRRVLAAMGIVVILLAYYVYSQPRASDVPQSSLPRGRAMAVPARSGTHSVTAEAHVDTSVHAT